MIYLPDYFSIYFFYFRSRPQFLFLFALVTDFSLVASHSMSRDIPSVSEDTVLLPVDMSSKLITLFSTLHSIINYFFLKRGKNNGNKALVLFLPNFSKTSSNTSLKYTSK